MFLLAAAIGAGMPTESFAQTYPGKVINMVVPYPPGGATDASSRLVALHLSRVLGQPIAVENVSGAAGAIGAQKVLRSNPDGYTLLAGTINEVILAPIVNPGLPYKFTSLSAIGPGWITPFILVANPKVEASDFGKLSTYLRKNPRKINVGIPGVGTLQHIALSMLETQAKVEWVSIPYKGAAPLMVDLMSGQIDLAMVTLPSAVQYIRDGKLKPLGLMSSRRDEVHKDLPTINEGREVKGINTDAWVGLFAPPKTPVEIVQKLNRALKEVMASAEVRDGLSKIGYRPMDYSTAAQFDKFLQDEDSRYRRVAANLKFDR